jgi:hypothetical protein
MFLAVTSTFFEPQIDIRESYQSPRNVNIVTCLTKYTLYRGADKSLARPGRKQATATEDFEFHISYIHISYLRIITIGGILVLCIYIKQYYHQMKYSHRQTKYIGK